MAFVKSIIQVAQLDFITSFISLASVLTLRYLLQVFHSIIVATLILSFHCRRCNIAEAILSERIDVVADVDSNDEGAKLYKMLETAAEPEVLMADMTSQQLISFSAYQTKQNVCLPCFISRWLYLKNVMKKDDLLSGD